MTILNTIKIWNWKRRNRLYHHLNALQQISTDINGFQLSKQARLQYDAMDYVYGEIDNIAFAALLSLVQTNNDTVFYDLGSGSGKTVMLYAMLFPQQKSCGIELFDTLHQAALIQKRRLGCLPDYQDIASKITYIQDNFLNVDLNDATVIYINSTSYFGDTWTILNHKLSALPNCTTIITTSKPLITPTYKVAKITRVQMSWGIVHAYIHVKG